VPTRSRKPTVSDLCRERSSPSRQKTWIASPSDLGSAGRDENGTALWIRSRKCLICSSVFLNRALGFAARKLIVENNVQQ
jgi:hypothetical protein